MSDETLKLLKGFYERNPDLWVESFYNIKLNKFQKKWIKVKAKCFNMIYKTKHGYIQRIYDEHYRKC